MNDYPDHDEANVEALFQTGKGVVVHLTDGRVLAPEGEKYAVFSSLEQYRRFTKDYSEWMKLPSFVEYQKILDIVRDLPTKPTSTADAPRTAIEAPKDADFKPAASTGPAARIFISYSRKDMAFVDRLEAALKARGLEPLIDRAEIYAFEDWWKRIQGLIGRADTVVFVLSPDAVASEVALKEVAHAATLNKRFAPIVCKRVEDRAVPEPLRRVNFIFFDDLDPARFEASADQLAKALQTDIAWIRRHTEFGEAARRWSEASRTSGLLLRPPVLDQAEAWMAFRPGGAPSPTWETEAFIAASRKAEVAARRRGRILNTGFYTMLIGITLGFVGWINESYLVDQWRRWTVTRPYMISQVRPHVLTPAQEAALKPADSFKECAQDCPEMIVVPAGSFLMGNPTGVFSWHTVRFAEPFAVSKFELTFADWDACVTGGGCNGYKPNDQGWGRGQQPVINVSWDDAQAYVAWLNAMTGKTYRLLSEAEYEYATRAWTGTAYPWGNDIGKNNAACNGCGDKWLQTAPVGSFAPNKFGLYDMVGNVWEWTQDCYHDAYSGTRDDDYFSAPDDGSAWLEANGGDCSYRIVRGGSWIDAPDSLRSTFRVRNSTGARNYFIGFRVGRTLIAPSLSPTAAPTAPVQITIPPLSATHEQALKPGDAFQECAKCPKMMVVPAGSFTMGSPASEPGRYPDEGPQHGVTIGRQFAIGQFELTFDEWDDCVADGGCHKPPDQGWGRGSRPVINVSWDDANAYVAWLAKKTGKPYRLLSEAEYEYATRAGTTTAYPWGDEIGNNNANCAGCGSQWDDKQTAPVGSFPANKFGLYDMGGNVSEWVGDCYHDSYNGAPIDGSAWISGDCSRRVLRGGYWGSIPWNLRSAIRDCVATDNRVNYIGFRVARTLLTP
jgi:formylglycine-generating enzyme required for sulfatase activity